MIPIVNDKYKYIFYYNPKSACSTYRKLFLNIHKDELSLDQKDINHHNINLIWKFDDKKDYSDYFKFSVVRNPFNRIVSAYLDKCCEIKYKTHNRFINKDLNSTIHDKIFLFLNRPPDFKKGYSFEEFVDYLVFNVNKPVDIHFKPQYVHNLKLDAFYRIEDQLKSYRSIYNEIFKNDPPKRRKALRLLKETKLEFINGTFINHLEPKYPKGGLFKKSFSELKNLYDQKLKFRYASFYNEAIKDKIAYIFRKDLEAYNYKYPYNNLDKKLD